MSLQSRIESILFVADKPLSEKKLALITGASLDDVVTAVSSLRDVYLSSTERGVVLVSIEDRHQLATHPDNAELIAEYLKQDFSGELTRPALETLSVISYRGPVTKPEIEEIRGVNCSLSLRNLLVRGLIEFKENAEKGEKTYSVSHDYLRHLGVSTLPELPNYALLHAVEEVAQEDLTQTLKSAE
ncbi:MAG: SMC-Scp complex subunit ScpB [bacterium]|nr:SMC-Scp complex subunit ScpB [bacterium]